MTMRSVARWVLVLGVVFVAACAKYPQDSPESVLVSARQMVKDGHADRLTDLIYADNKEMRGLLDAVGNFLGDLQVLGGAVRKAYPKEIQKLEADAAEAAKNGEATGFLSKMMGQMTQGRRRRGPPVDDDGKMQEAFNNAAKELFADPYGWLARSEGRLTVQRVSDDTAALMWDGQPVFGVGMLLVQKDGRWYLMLPTQMPLVSRAMPRTAEGWEIMGDLVQVFDSMVTDLTDDVKHGRCRRLDELANKAGEKAFIPAVMVFFAYEQYQRAERKADRAKGGPPPGPVPAAPAPAVPAPAPAAPVKPGG